MNGHTFKKIFFVSASLTDKLDSQNVFQLKALKIKIKTSIYIKQLLNWLHRKKAAFFPFLPRHYHMTHVLLLPFITTVWTPVVTGPCNN